MELLALVFLASVAVGGIFWFRSRKQNGVIATAQALVGDPQLLADAAKLDAEAAVYERNYPRIAAFKRGFAEHLRDLARRKVA